MKLVLAAGCPYTDWEMVVSTLAAAGLGRPVATLVEWQDQVLAESGLQDPLQLRQPLQPDSSMQERLARLLVEGQADSRHLVVGKCPWLLDFWATRYPDTQFLLFFTGAETALAAALMRGIDPIRFIDDWKANLQHLMRFQRRYRQNALLLSAEAANLCPEALVEAGRSIGLSLQFPAESVSWETPVLPEMERFLAHRLVADDPSIRALHTELEARAQPLGDWLCQGSEVPLENLLKYYLQTRQDREQLRSDLHCVQHELEYAVLERQEVEKTHHATVAELQQLKARIVEAEQDRKKLEVTNQALEATNTESLEESELLLKQLHAVQEELEQVFLAKQEVEKTHQATVAELQPLQARILQAKQAGKKLEATNRSLETGMKEALARSESLAEQLQRVLEELKGAALQRQVLEQTEKVTGAELQQLKAIVVEAERDRKKLEVTNQSLEAANTEVLDENELLLKQLHAVQDELEHYFLKYQETLTRQDAVAEEQVPVLEGAPELRPLVQRTGSAGWTNRTLMRALVKPFKRPDPQREKIRRQVEVIEQSGLFDEKWYLAEYPDVASTGINPKEHYLRFGAAEGRNPSPVFDTKYYLQSNPDVAAAGVNPLLHYIEFGILEGREPC
jgi:hypothetical protein